MDIFDEEDEVERYSRNIRTVWNITLEKLNETERQLLCCFAYMSPDIIALDWLVEHAKKLRTENEKAETDDSEVSAILRKFIVSRFSPDLIAILTDDVKRNAAVRKLAKYSLITIKANKTITMHGLLQEAIRKTITDSVYLRSVWEVLKSKRSDVGLIHNNYHIALPSEQAKAMMLNAETLLHYGKEYEEADGKSNIILKCIDEARKLYTEVCAPVSKSLIQEPTMSYHAFNNFGDLWHEFGFLPEAIECYELALKVGFDDKKGELLGKIANCKNGGSCNV